MVDNSLFNSPPQSAPDTARPKVPLGANSAWLAAFVLGLAHSHDSDDHRRVSALIEVTNGDSRYLDAARRRVAPARFGDRRLRDEALRLLDAASNQAGQRSDSGVLH